MGRSDSVCEHQIELNECYAFHHRRENSIAELRHLVMQVPELVKAAGFYEQCFDMKRVNKVAAPMADVAVLPDGVMNLTLLNIPEGAEGLGQRAKLGALISFRVRVRPQGGGRPWLST